MSARWRRCSTWTRSSERRRRRSAQGQGKAGRRPTWRPSSSAATMRASISSARCRSACATPRAPRARSWSPATRPAGLGAVYAGATVCAWYPITPSTSLAEGFEKHARRMRVDQGRQAALRHRAGRGRAGRDRRCHRRRLERRALVHGDLRPRHLADERIPRPRLLRRDPGRAVQHPARRPVDRHADAHRAARHHLVRLRLATATPSTCCCSRPNPTECFSMGAEAFDLAERLQTPVMVMSDLDIGMNDWITDPFDVGRRQGPRSRQGAVGGAARGLQGR